MGNNLCYSSVTHHSVNTVSSCQSLCHSCITPPGHKPDTLGDCAAAAAAQSCDIVFSHLSRISWNSANPAGHAWQERVVLLPGGCSVSTGSSLHSGQQPLQLLHLQLPHPSVKRGELGEVCHLHGTDDWLRGDGLDDTHHHDICACKKNSSRWSIVQWQHIRGGGTWLFVRGRYSCAVIILRPNAPALGTHIRHTRGWLG